MPHDLSLFDYELPDIDEYLSGDDRTIVFQVVDDTGTGVDISGATVEWSLHERAYQDSSDSTVLSGDDSEVELVTDNRTNPTNGQWEVRIGNSATVDDIYGEYWHRPRVIQSLGTSASWRGKIIITA